VLGHCVGSWIGKREEEEGEEGGEEHAEVRAAPDTRQCQFAELEMSDAIIESRIGGWEGQKRVVV
jgi:cytidylate kinase